MNNLCKVNRKKTEKRGEKSPLTFKKAKNNTIKSINEVGCFFYNFSHFLKYVKLYKIFK